jgi:tight adherence protein B
VTRRRGSISALALGLLTAAVAGAGPAAGLAVAAIGGAGWLLRRQSRCRAARERERRAEVEALRALAAELTAGASPETALSVVADDLAGVPGGPGREAGAVAAALAAAGRAGTDPATADVLHSSGSPGVRGLGAAWQLSTETGAPLADCLARLAAAASMSAATAREVRATLAGPRLTARLLALLPLAGIGMAALSGAHPIGILLNTGPGQICLAVGVGLDVAGLLWIERLASGADP